MSRNCRPIWPVPDKEMMHLPEDFFNEPGYVCYINPKEQYKRYFIAHLHLYRAENMKRITVRYGYGVNHELFTGMPVINATIVKRVLRIDSSNIYRQMDNDVADYFTELHEGLDVLHTAVDMFNEVFTKQ